MGNCFSTRVKQADPEAAGSKCEELTSLLAARDEELSKIKEELEVNKALGSQASNDASILREQVRDLEVQDSKTERERNEYIADLESIVKQKEEEILAHGRVTESRTNERDEARNTLQHLQARMEICQDEIEKLRNEKKIHEERNETQTRETEAVLASKKRDVETTNSRLSELYSTIYSLRDEIQTVRMQKKTSDEEFESYQKTAESAAAAKDKELEKAKRQLSILTKHVQRLKEQNIEVQENLSITNTRPSALDDSNATLKKELEAARTNAAQDEAKVQALSAELNSTKSTLATHQAERNARRDSIPVMTSNSYIDPYQFSKSGGKDVRVGVGQYDGETRVDIRQWYHGTRSTKGVSLHVRDARELTKVLPDVVRAAKVYEKGA